MFLIGYVQIVPPGFTPFQSAFFHFDPTEHDQGSVWHFLNALWTVTGVLSSYPPRGAITSYLHIECFGILTP